MRYCPSVTGRPWQVQRTLTSLFPGGESGPKADPVTHAAEEGQHDGDRAFVAPVGRLRREGAAYAARGLRAFIPVMNDSAGFLQPGYVAGVPPGSSMISLRSLGTAPRRRMVASMSWLSRGIHSPSGPISQPTSII